MDPLTIIGFLISIILMLLGLVMMFSKSSPKKEKADIPTVEDEIVKETQEQQSPALKSVEQIELFTHLPHNPPKTEKVPPIFSLNSNDQIMTSVEKTRVSLPAATETNHIQTTLQPVSTTNINVDSSSVDFSPLHGSELNAADIVSPESTQIQQPVVEPLVSKQTNVVGQYTQEALPLEVDAGDASVTKDDDSKNKHVAANSPLLSQHLGQLAEQDTRSLIANATKMIAIYLVPRNNQPIPGDEFLAIMREYGFKYGDMSLFHRYTSVNGSGELLFSVFKYDSISEISAFDMASIVSDQIPSLAFMLTLPNPVAVQAFDMMMHLSELISRRLDAFIYDEESSLMTRQSYEFMRQEVAKYS